MERIYVCSPFKGDISKNQENAKRYARYVYEQGKIPVVPHLYFPQFLNEDIAEEREEGIRLALKLVETCREIWVFGDKITEGMCLEMTHGIRLNIPFRYFETHVVVVKGEVAK